MVPRVIFSLCPEESRNINNRDPFTTHQLEPPRPESISPPTAWSRESPGWTERWQMGFVMTVTGTIKLTIITIFALRVSIHNEHVFLFSKYKEIHRMILYTTYNKYCVSYILLVERVCDGGVCTPLCLSFFFSPVGGFIYFFHIATLHESLPLYTGWGLGWDGWGCFRCEAGLLMSLPPPALAPPPPSCDAGGCGASSAPWAPSGLWPWGRPAGGLQTASSPGSTDWSGSSPAGWGWWEGPCTGQRWGSTGCCWNAEKMTQCLLPPPPARCSRPGWTAPPTAAWPASVWSSSPWPCTGTCPSQRAAETAGGAPVLSSEPGRQSASAHGALLQAGFQAHFWIFGQNASKNSFTFQKTIFPRKYLDILDKFWATQTDHFFPTHLWDTK